MAWQRHNKRRKRRRRRKRRKRRKKRRRRRRRRRRALVGHHRSNPLAFYYKRQNRHQPGDSSPAQLNEKKVTGLVFCLASLPIYMIMTPTERRDDIPTSLSLFLPRTEWIRPCVCVFVLVRRRRRVFDECYRAIIIPPCHMQPISSLRICVTSHICT